MNRSNDLKKLTKLQWDNLYLAHYKVFLEHEHKNENFQSLLFKKLNKKTIEYSKNKTINTLLVKLNKRTAKVVKYYHGHDDYDYEPEMRLMIGGGGETPYKNITLMTLHQTYGVPYLPATAIKGCLRHYYSLQEQPADLIEKLFGSENIDKEEGIEKKGCLVFFDTFPSKFSLTFDVMTPHHSVYYASSGTKLPSDSQNKTPIQILCVTNDSKFKIYVACTDNTIWQENKVIIMGSLQRALEEYGIGAKTAYGYGLAKNQR